MRSSVHMRDGESALSIQCPIFTLNTAKMVLNKDHMSTHEYCLEQCKREQWKGITLLALVLVVDATMHVDGDVIVLGHAWERQARF